MTATNPLPKAIHAAWCELTTPDAQLWYKAKASQAKAIATFASTIASTAFATVQHWLKSESGSAIVWPNNRIEDLHEQPTEPAEVDAIVVSDLEAVESMPEASDDAEGIGANISEPLDLEDDPTELRPAIDDTEYPSEDSLEGADDLAEGEEGVYLESWAEEEPLNKEVDMYLDSEIDSTEESANERVHA
jgi:hypothetical protein